MYLRSVEEVGDITSPFPLNDNATAKSIANDTDLSTDNPNLTSMGLSNAVTSSMMRTTESLLTSTENFISSTSKVTENVLTSTVDIISSTAISFAQSTASVLSTAFDITMTPVTSTVNSTMDTTLPTTHSPPSEHTSIIWTIPVVLGMIFFFIGVAWVIYHAMRQCEICVTSCCYSMFGFCPPKDRKKQSYVTLLEETDVDSDTLYMKDVNSQKSPLREPFSSYSDMQ